MVNRRNRMMNRMSRIVVAFALFALTLALVGVGLGQAQESGAAAAPAPNTEAARIFRGYQISPVPLHLRNLDRDLVGLGSYIVNAQGACNDCHTNPPYAAGGDPYMGQPKKVNAENFLAGGQAFGPF